MNIAIAGCGYVGLVTAAVLANLGHDVTSVDVDKDRIALLNEGICPIYEMGLQDFLTKNHDRLHFILDYVSAYKSSEVVFIAVGTPDKADGSADLKYVYTAVEQILESVDKDCVVVVKSTVPIGTTDKIQQYMNKKIKGDIKIRVVSNPEFLSQGTALDDMVYASRIVIGSDGNEARAIMEKVYGSLGVPMIFTDRCSAEMIKYASNDFLALKISYINEIANLCEILGADIMDVAKGMGMDPRIGDRFLKSGIGYGGSCFPKDTKALHWLSNYHDYELKTIKATIEVNSLQKTKLIKKARKYYDDFSNLTVAALGLAFKPGTDDLREAPSLDNIPILLDYGASIKAWDPIAEGNFRRYFPNGITYCGSIQEALADTDICFIYTDWDDIKTLDPRSFLSMRHPIILDGRNCFSLEAMSGYPLIYDSIGRRTIRNI